MLQGNTCGLRLQAGDQIPANREKSNSKDTSDRSKSKMSVTTTKLVLHLTHILCRFSHRILDSCSIFYKSF